MLFNSLQYLVFLPLVIILYYQFPHRYRWFLLVFASYLFYFFSKSEYVLLLLSSTIVTYFTTIEIGKTQIQKRKLYFLLLNIGSNMLFIGLFKYLDLLSFVGLKTLSKIGISLDLPSLRLIMPIALSFFTFQSLSYTLDVYKGDQKSEKHFGFLALYLSFFPQLLAGPIERFKDLGPQLRIERKFEYKNLLSGLRFILVGFFLKVVLADNISPHVDAVFNDPTLFQRSSIFLSWILFSIQIYSDFFAYTLIAIGSAKILGITLVDNFRTPYLSKSMADFWSRWHISLTNWFKDYLYNPISGNSKGKWRIILSILLVFFIVALWHGPALKYIIWALLLSLFLIIELGLTQLGWIKNAKDFSFGHFFKSIIIFIIITFAWAIFRSNDFGDFIEMLRLLFDDNSPGTLSLSLNIELWIFIGVFIVSDLLLYNKSIAKVFEKLNVTIRWILYAFMLISILVFGSMDSQPFIYFQF